MILSPNNRLAVLVRASSFPAGVALRPGRVLNCFGRGCVGVGDNHPHSHDD